MSKLRLGIIAGVIALLAAAAGGVAYLTQPHQAAQKFTLTASPAPAATAAPSGLAGTWVIDAGSQAGYRVKEHFVDQPAETEAVARTSTVTGQLVIAGGSGGGAGGGLQLKSATFSADLSKLTSTDTNATHGPAVRDRFVARIYLETAVYPMATLVSKPAAITAFATPADITVTGSFTLHGVSHDVSIPLRVSQNDDHLEVVGSFRVRFQDYKIDVPSVPFTTAAPDATVEVHLFLKHQG